MENSPNLTGGKEFSKDFSNLKICKRYDQVVTPPPMWRNFDRPITPWSVLHLVYLLLTMHSFDTTIKLWCRAREVMGTSNQILTCAAKLRRIISKTIWRRLTWWIVQSLGVINCCSIKSISWIRKRNMRMWTYWWTYKKTTTVISNTRILKEIQFSFKKRINHDTYYNR